jgi:hypothetical protein
MPSSSGFSSSSSKAGSIDCVDSGLLERLVLRNFLTGESGEEVVELVSVIFSSEIEGFDSVLAHAIDVFMAVIDFDSLVLGFDEP